MTCRILIVDDDPWVRSMVGTMLRQGGHNVQTATNGEEGLQMARDEPPDLIITDVMMDQMDGWTFVRHLRSEKETSLIPLMFLTALSGEEHRIRGFQLGADDFLTKPFRFEELNLRIERMLRNIQRLKQAAGNLRQHTSSQAGLKGDLGQLGVSSLLTVLELDRKSGVLVLTREEGAGRIFLRNGHVIAAYLEHDDSCMHADAIYVMLSWEQGTFEFTALDVEMEDHVETPTTQLLMEGMRRLDEARAGL